MRRLILLWVAILVGLAGYSPAFSELTMAVLEFDGTGNHLILPRSAFEGVEEVTVEAWVRWGRFAKDSPVFWFGMAGNSAKLYNDGDSRHLMFALRDAIGDRHDIRIKNGLERGRWHHIAVMCRGSGDELRA